MKRWLGPLVAVAILVVLLVAVFAGGPPAQEEEGPEDLSILSVSKKDITQIRLWPATGDEVILQREGEEWWVEPGHLKANQVRVDYLADTLATLQGTRRLPPPDDPAAFGLNEPGLVAEVTLKEGPKLTLRVGDALPVSSESGGKEYYAQAVGQPELFVIPGSAVEQMQASRNDFRNLYFARFTLADVQSFRVTRGGEGLEVRRASPDAGWKIAAPVSAAADADQVTAVLNKIDFLEVKEYVQDNPTPADLAAYGLDEPQAEIRVRFFPEAGTPELVVQIGKKSAGGYYARRPDEPYVYIIDPQVVEELMIGPEDLTVAE